MKKQIVHVSVLQSSKVMALLYLVLSLPMVALMILSAMAGGEPFSFTMLVLLPVIYTVVGFIFTALAAWVYNIIAGKIGGFEFTTIDVDKH